MSDVIMIKLDDAIRITKARLDNCTHPECIADRKRLGYSTCAGGRLAHDVVGALLRHGVAKARRRKR